MAEGEYRLRVCYSKSGRLRWLSHLEVVHALERGARRAGVPYAITRGFSPHMKIAFGPALPVGTAGENEYYDLWVSRYTDADTLLDSLIDAMSHDLAPKAAEYVADGEPSLAAALTVAKYRVLIDGKEMGAEKVRMALKRFAGSRTFSVTQKGKQKVFDLARCLPEEMRVSESAKGSEVLLTIRAGSEGSLRPEVLIRAALEAASLDAPVVYVTRTDTFIEQEEGSWVCPL